ncbi:hypothetical protein SDC9_131502 [bioreactor metagenome]|uniref:Uncharacterized protein n=1 Tax=bioreactor metagenome TaxID=1076179 RepID=A0A645D4M1_9ZZZZ
MAAGHLVARLQTTLDGKVHLDHLLHTRRQFVALRQLALLDLERLIEILAGILKTLTDRLKLDRQVLVCQTNVEPVIVLQRLQVLHGDLGALGKLLRAAIGLLTNDHALHTGECITLDDTHLVCQIGLERAQLVIDDRLRTLVPFDAFAGKYLHVDDGTGHA